MKRRGVALVLVLLAMLVTACLAAGVLVATSTQTRASGETLLAFRAAEAAERGAIQAAASWLPESSLTIPVGATLGPLLTRYADTTVSRAFTTRLSPGNFWITSLGTTAGVSTPAPVTRRVGVLYTLGAGEPHLVAAVTVADSLLAAGSAVVDGSDTNPPLWGSFCTSSLRTAAAAAALDTTRICDGVCGAPSGAHLTGSPATLVDSAAALLAGGRVGQITWTWFAAHAQRVLPGGISVTPGPRLTATVPVRCDTSLANNWGDPTRAGACANRFVIVHAKGDLVVNGGMGQGVLLVDGDVDLRNGAQFVGLILARDDVTALAGANRVWGAVLAADGRRASGDHSIIAGSTVVTYSSCAVEMALMGTAPLRRAAQRAWHQLY